MKPTEFIKDWKEYKPEVIPAVPRIWEVFYKKIVDDKEVSKKTAKKKQARYITKYVYIADSDAYEKDINVYGLNCPNCGAVVHSLKKKNCSYCKTGLNIQVVDLLKCWKLIECEDN